MTIRKEPKASAVALGDKIIKYQDVVTGMWLEVVSAYAADAKSVRTKDIIFILNKNETLYVGRKTSCFRGGVLDKMEPANLNQKDATLRLIDDPVHIDELDAIRHRLWLQDLAKCGPDRGYDTSLMIGSDPEIFVVDENGVVVPAFDFLPSEPQAKQLAPYEPFWDGFQAEFNIPHKYCHAWCMDGVQAGLQAVWLKAIKHNPKATLTHKSVLNVPEEMMQRVTPKQAGLGCMPSLNVYTDEALNVPDGRDLPFRFAGCHIHYGHGKMAQSEVQARVRAMDHILGPIMTSLLGGLEDPRRRQFYGKAGEHRLPPHGLEYRVPSSTILVHPIVAHIVFDIARMSSYLGSLGSAQLWEMPGGDTQVQHILNNYDLDEARANIKLNTKMMHHIIKACYGYSDAYKPENRDRAMRMILKGAKEFVDLDMVKNWHLITQEQFTANQKAYRNERPAPHKAWITHSNAQDASVVTMLETLK